MGSVRRRADRVRVRLEEPEVWLLLSMTTQLIALLGADERPQPPRTGAAGLPGLLASPLDPVDAPDDPILQRLLPDAYRDDQDASVEFRRLTEADLRATKRGGLARIVTDLSGDDDGARAGNVTFDLDEDGTAAWLAALTDLRLALGTRIGVTEDMDEERETLPVESPRFAEIATYDWLSWLQDAMVRAVMGD